MEFFLLVILGVMLLVFKRTGIGDYFSPWMITCEIWFVMMFMVQFQGDLLYPMNDQFFFSLMLWVPIFCASAIITYKVLPVKEGRDYTGNFKLMSVNMLLFNLFFIITVFITPMQLYMVMKLVSMFDSQDMLGNIRLLAVYGDTDFGFLNYAHVINQVLFIIALWHYPHIRGWKVAVLIGTNFLSCFSMMEKSGIFFIILSSLFVLFKKNIISTKTIITVIICIVGFFFLFNNVMAGAYSDTNGGEKGMEFLDFFACYVLSPPVAFGMIQPELEGQFGSHTFQYIYLFLDRWGLGDYIVHQRIQDYVLVPIPTNVYTIFQPFFEDFKYRGIAFFALVYGTFSGFAYRYFINGSSAGRCIYALIVEVLVLQFYSESFIQNLVLSLQFIFFVVLITQNKYTFDLSGFIKNANK